MAANEHQKKQREATIASALEAAATLQKKGVPLTLRGIAEEAELSHATILKPEIKAELYKRFSFSRSKKTESQEVDELKRQITELQEKLAKSHKVNANLRKDCKLLKEKLDKADAKYRYLLMQYASNIDKNVIQI